MSNHFKRQHNGLGISSEPIQENKSEEMYDAAARQYRMLMSQGTNYDKNRQGGSYPSRDLLLSNGGGREGSLCTYAGLLAPISNEGWADGEVYADRGDEPRQVSVCSNQRGADSRLKFPLRITVLVAFCSAVLVGVAWLLGKFTVWAIWELIGIVSHMSRFWWLVDGSIAYVLFCVFIFSLIRIAGISDRRAAEMGRGK